MGLQLPLPASGMYPTELLRLAELISMTCRAGLLCSGCFGLLQRERKRAGRRGDREGRESPTIEHNNMSYLMVECKLGGHKIGQEHTQMPCQSNTVLNACRAAMI